MGKANADRQRRFVEEYCVDFNGAAAAERAGYSKRRARQTAYDLLQKPEIREAIDTRMRELSMSAAEATLRMTNWGRGTIEPFLTEDGRIDLNSPAARQNLGLVKKVKVKERRLGKGKGAPVIERRTELELHDAKDAVVQIAKIQGLYKHEIALGGDEGGLTIRVVSG